MAAPPKSVRFSKKRKAAVKAGFRSGFEQEFARKYPDLLFEPKAFPYCIEQKKVVSHEDESIVIEDKTLIRHYTPDFVTKDGSIWYELKGRWVAADRTKIRNIRKALPNQRLIMVFERPNQRISKTSKTTYATYCDKYGIEWISKKESLA